MINDTFDQIPLSPKWQAYFEKRRQQLAQRDFPGMSRTRASLSSKCTADRRKKQ